MPDEKIERLRSNRNDHLDQLACKAARWTADNLDALRDADPALPDEMHDRAQDNWRLLIAIADQISPQLGERARAAAIAISNEEISDEDNAAIMALADCAAIFEQECKDQLMSDSLLNKLLAIEDRPWSEWRRGRALTKVGLARLLRPFGIRPKTLRFDNSTVAKGYEAEPIREAQVRYCDDDRPAEENAKAPEIRNALAFWA